MSGRTPNLKIIIPAAIALASLSACVTAEPSPQEKALVADSQAKATLLPASRAERDIADRQDLITQATFWSKEYDKNPNDPEAQFKFARILRAMGSAQRAVEIAGPALGMKPDNYEMAMIFAQASLDLGKPQDAAIALAAAEAAGQNDWRMLSLIGVTMDQLDQHKQARTYYQRALTLSPENGSKILSNIGLSYALEGDPANAEIALRKAVASPNADPRAKQNLAIVLGVQGKFEEAAKAAGDDVPKALIDANTTYFKALLTPARNWDKLRGEQN